MDLYATDWLLLETGVNELEQYLLSPVLYWPLSTPEKKNKPGDISHFTIGNLLLSLKRLDGVVSEKSQRENFETKQLIIKSIQTKWLANWRKKADVEFDNRINLWQQFISELGKYDNEGWYGYAYNVRHRVILELLRFEILSPFDEHYSILEVLDWRLREFSREGCFVWDDNLITTFPSAEYWYLYRQALLSRKE